LIYHRSGLPRMSKFFAYSPDRHFTSPFGWLFLLVRLWRDEWRFCRRWGLDLLWIISRSGCLCTEVLIFWSDLLCLWKCVLLGWLSLAGSSVWVVGFFVGVLWQSWEVEDCCWMVGDLFCIWSWLSIVLGRYWIAVIFLYCLWHWQIVSGGCSFVMLGYWMLSSFFYLVPSLEEPALSSFLVITIFLIQRKYYGFILIDPASLCEL